MWKTTLILALFVVAVPVSCALADVSYWIAPACAKITENAPALKDTSPLTLHAARGEYAAFQVCLRPESDISGVTVDASGLKGQAVIGSRNVTVWREYYVKTNEGRLPDPLSPWKKVDLSAGVNQPVYVEIHVPSSAAQGDYTGSITFVAGEKTIATAQFGLHVYGFSLPVAPSLRTAFGLQDDQMAIQEKISTTSPAYQTYRKAYYEIMLDHGLSSYSLPVDIKSAEAQKYLADPRMTSYVIPYSEDDATMKQTLDYLRKGGWLGKGYFYVVDEPLTREQYTKITAIADRLHAIDPSLKIVSPYYGPPDWNKELTPFDLLTGKMNIWCYNTSYYHPDKLAARQKAGDEVWDYVCCGPGKPYTNFFITNDAIDHRVLFWQNYKYDTTGLLYWSANYWNNSDTGTTDPWVDMATIKWINKDIYGDGSLLYPGRKVGHYGPLPSLRLKLIRQGMQDCEYLKLAEAKAGKARVKKIVDSQSEDWKVYQKDPAKLDAAKRQLAALIEDP